MSQLAITSLSKAYGAFKVFDGLNLEAEAGEIVVIFGGSGTGKTILLRLIAGVEEPTSGMIEIGGHDVSDIAPEHRGVGMAFQNFALFPHMSAAENIATPLRAAGAAEDKVKAGRRQGREAPQDRPCAEPQPARTLQRPEAAHGTGPRAGRRARRSCCWTIRCATSMPSSASRCASNCRAFSARAAPRCST